MTLTAIALAASLAAGSCDLDSTSLPAYTGDVAESVSRFADIPHEAKLRLRERIEKHRFDEVVEIRRDAIDGASSYAPELTGLQYDKTHCSTVSRKTWSLDTKEVALSYCEGERCVLVTVNGRHMLRADRALSASDPQDLLRQYPTASGAQSSVAGGRLLVGARAGLSDAEADKQVRGHGASKARRIGKTNLFIVDLPNVGNETAMQALLSRNPHFSFAELDRRVPASLSPNDPYVGSQWHLNVIGAPTAWDTTQGAGVTVAILDSGVNGAHQDLSGRMVAGWNVIDGNSNTSDVHGHGTVVAGSAVASLNNGMGVAAIAGGARLMPVRVADATAYAYFSDVAKGISWAADNGARIANVSYGGVAGSSSVRSAADYMRSKGGLVVVSAGNNGREETTGATTSMLVVSGTTSADALASWSSWGSFVTIAAPGDGIWTTDIGGSYRAASGTSFAAPIVAGVAALVMAARPDLSNSQVENILYSSAKDLGDVGRDKLYGFGRVNAAGAVQAALATKATDTQAPSASVVSPSAGASMAGVVTVDATATDNVGVVKADLLVDGVAVATATSAPYAFSWDSSKHANGSRTLSVRASDAAGNVGTSAGVAVSVANAVPAAPADTTAPVVQLLNPAAGAVLSGTVGISVSASDNAGASGIKQSLYIDDALVASSSGGSLSYSWNTRKATKGSHTIKAVATDAAGNVGTVSIQVTTK